jgi:hypothetical protein
MSLSIDIDRVSDVLLADGWHRVIFQNGESTFLIDAYEYIQRREGGDPEILVGGGSVPGVPSTGASWIDAKAKRTMTCPLTSILAVMVRPPKKKS